MIVVRNHAEMILTADYLEDDTKEHSGMPIILCEKRSRY